MATHDVLAVSGLLGKARKHLLTLEQNLLNNMLPQPRKSPNLDLGHHTYLSILARPPSAIHSIGLWGNQKPPVPEFTIQSFKSCFRFLVANAVCAEDYKKFLVFVDWVELTVFCKPLRGAMRSCRWR